jgi:outer membrane protein OmpA-like peptidoglycan-associated protein
MPRSARWLLLLLGAAGCAAALGAALGYGIPRLLLARLQSSTGAPLEAEPGFDWRRWRVVLSRVNLPADESGRTGLRIERLTVPLDPRWLWQRDPLLRDLEVDGARLVLHRDTAGRLRFTAPAGGTVPGAARDAATGAAERTAAGLAQGTNASVAEPGTTSATAFHSLRIADAIARSTQLIVLDDGTKTRTVLRARAWHLDRLVAARGANGASLDLRARSDTRGNAAAVRWRAAAADVRLAVRVQADRLPLRGLGTALGHPELCCGEMTGRALYRRRVAADGAVAESLDGDARLAHLRVRSPGAGALRIDRMALRGLHLEPQRRRVRCADARLRGGELRLSLGGTAPSGDAHGAADTRPWRPSIGRLELRRIAVALDGLETAPSFELRFAAAHDLGMPPASPAARVRLAFENGGSARLHTLPGFGEPGLRALARLDRVPLTGLPGAAGEPLRISGGTLSGWAVFAGEGDALAAANLRLDELRVDGRDRGAWLPLLGARRIAAALEQSSLQPLRLRVREATLEAPHLVIVRTSEGVLPFNLLGELAASPALRPWLESRPSSAPGDAADGAPPDVPLHAAIGAGSVRLEDRLVRPPVAVELGDVAGDVRQATAPARSSTLSLRGSLAPAGSFQLAGASDAQGRAMSLSVSDLDPSVLDTYLRALIGHTATGQASISVDLLSDPAGIAARAVLGTAALELTQVRDANPFDEALGMPLRQVVDLVQRAPGELDLDVAVGRTSGSEETGRAAIARGLREAIADQLVARLAGAPTGAPPSGAAADAASAATPADAAPAATPAERQKLGSIAFPPAKAALDDASGLPVERLALLLRLEPDARLTVRGQVGKRDGRLSPAAQAALARARADWVVEQLIARAGAARDRVSSGEPSAAAEGGVALEVELPSRAAATSETTGDATAP